MNKYYSFVDDNLSLHYSITQAPKPDEFYIHMHDFCELFYFLDGSGVYKIEGSEYHLRTGDILILRPAEAHYIDIKSSEPYERMTINFNTDLFSSLDTDNELLKPFFDREVGKSNLYRSSDFSTNAHKYFLENLMTETQIPKIQILSNLFGLLNEISLSFQNKNNTTTSQSLSYEIVSYINRHLTESLNLNTICERFYISKPHLCRIFKNATGTTVSDYITVKRLLRARQLINQGESPTKVAIQCGFNDYSVFYRSYVKKYKIPPSKQIEI